MSAYADSSKLRWHFSLEGITVDVVFCGSRGISTLTLFVGESPFNIFINLLTTYKIHTVSRVCRFGIIPNAKHNKYATRMNRHIATLNPFMVGLMIVPPY